MADQEVLFVAKGYYLAKCVKLTQALEFTIHRGVAGCEGKKVFMKLASPFALDDVFSKLNSDGWCIIKVCHKRAGISANCTTLTPYINEVHPMEK